MFTNAQGSQDMSICFWTFQDQENRDSWIDLSTEVFLWHQQWHPRENRRVHIVWLESFSSKRQLLVLKDPNSQNFTKDRKNPLWEAALKFFWGSILNSDALIRAVNFWVWLWLANEIQESQVDHQFLSSPIQEHNRYIASLPSPTLAGKRI